MISIPLPMEQRFTRQKCNQLRKKIMSLVSEEGDILTSQELYFKLQISIQVNFSIKNILKSILCLKKLCRKFIIEICKEKYTQITK